MGFRVRAFGLKFVASAYMATDYETEFSFKKHIVKLVCFLPIEDNM